MFDAVQDYETALRGIYACLSEPSCGDAGVDAWPAPPHGRVRGTVDVMLVGWNPQIAGFGAAPADFAEWREDGAGGLERAVRERSAWVRRIGGLLPPELPLDSGRVVNTRVWKWPSRTKSPALEARERAERCASRHLDAERAALKPRVILTYDKDAAAFFSHQAAQRAVTLEGAPPGHEYVLAWAAPSEKWGHRCGLILLKGRQVAYPAPTRAWCQDRIRQMLSA